MARTRVRTDVHQGTYSTMVWYTCTNITLSQKQLEIQAHVYHGTYVRTYNVMSQLLEKSKHVHREPRVFWEDTRQPVEGGSECRATHTYTLATALTPLP